MPFCILHPRKEHSHRVETPGGSLNRIFPDQRWGFGSFADDLFTRRADVLSRAATTLRSVESKASFGRTVYDGKQWSPAKLNESKRSGDPIRERLGFQGPSGLDTTKSRT
jgi:hypothetical protein